MISHLSGSVLHLGDKFALIDVAGIGYKVFVMPDTLVDLRKQKNKPVSLWTYLAVRENALDLYGFPEKEALDFFELLITVSGIGPKTALGVLSVTSIANLRQAIGTGDSAILTKISGIGRKLAEKIVRELAEKIEFLASEHDSDTMRDESDALLALESLGYRESDARNALKKIPKEITGTGERVKQALKALGR